MGIARYCSDIASLLYELIAAISEEIEASEVKLIAAGVTYLVDFDGIV